MKVLKARRRKRQMSGVHANRKASVNCNDENPFKYNQSANLLRGTEGYVNCVASIMIIIIYHNH